MKVPQLLKVFVVVMASHDEGTTSRSLSTRSYYGCHVGFLDGSGESLAKPHRVSRASLVEESALKKRVFLIYGGYLARHKGNKRTSKIVAFHFAECRVMSLKTHRLPLNGCSIQRLLVLSINKSARSRASAQPRQL